MWLVSHPSTLLVRQANAENKKRNGICEQKASRKYVAGSRETCNKPRSTHIVGSEVKLCHPGNGLELSLEFV